MTLAIRNHYQDSCWAQFPPVARCTGKTRYNETNMCRFLKVNVCLTAGDLNRRRVTWEHINRFNNTVFMWLFQASTKLYRQLIFSCQIFDVWSLYEDCLVNHCSICSFGQFLITHLLSRNFLHTFNFKNNIIVEVEFIYCI